MFVIITDEFICMVALIGTFWFVMMMLCSAVFIWLDDIIENTLGCRRWVTNVCRDRPSKYH